jgi:hypothetical protein
MHVEPIPLLHAMLRHSVGTTHDHLIHGVWHRLKIIACHLRLHRHGCVASSRSSLSVCSSLPIVQLILLLGDDGLLGGFPSRQIRAHHLDRGARSIWPMDQEFTIVFLDVLHLLFIGGPAV